MIPTHLAYAYPLRARESLHGRVHLVIDSDLDLGRLHRRSGDALCKPRRQFRALVADGTGGTGITCSPCADHYFRLVATGVLAPHGGRTSRHEGTGPA